MRRNTTIPRTEIRYCRETDRWLVHGIAPKPMPMYCGEQLFILVDGRYLLCRLELDRDWYVIFEDTRFYSHKRTHYQVSFF
ncbi:DUF5348 domain-containing protein [Effusibacillus consociatus]|uniref:DUF5348 domain-containing protein n=1 Tax=Effusibacillus consociatus TaxID=1117041 RepID=A0ABV9PYP5_9BACL